MQFYRVNYGSRGLTLKCDIDNASPFTLIGNEAYEELKRIQNKYFSRNNKVIVNVNKNYYFNDRKDVTVVYDNKEAVFRYINSKEKKGNRFLKSFAIGAGGTAFVSALLYMALSNPSFDDFKVIDLHEGELITTEAEAKEEVVEEEKTEVEKLVSSAYIVDDEEEPVYIDTTANYDYDLEKNVSDIDYMIVPLANTFGTDPNIMRDIVKQESSGGTLDNYTQVEFDTWLNQKVKVYNYDKNCYETFVLTDNPENFSNVDHVITREMFDEPYTNLMVGTAYFSFVYEQCNHNLSRAIQAYNFGIRGSEQVCEEASLKLDIPMDKLLNDSHLLDEIMAHTYIKGEKYGDHEYAYKVIRFFVASVGLEEDFIVAITWSIIE